MDRVVGAGGIRIERCREQCESEHLGQELVLTRIDVSSGSKGEALPGWRPRRQGYELGGSGFTRAAGDRTDDIGAAAILHRARGRTGVPRSEDDAEEADHRDGNQQRPDHNPYERRR